MLICNALIIKIYSNLFAPNPFIRSTVTKFSIFDPIFTLRLPIDTCVIVFYILIRQHKMRLTARRAIHLYAL
jgi:hypothetical protein